MLRARVLFLALGLTAVLVPRNASAWSEQPMPTNQDGSSKFADPDEKLDRLTGDDGQSGERQTPRAGFSTGSGSSGWSFSMTQGAAADGWPRPEAPLIPSWPPRPR